MTIPVGYVLRPTARDEDINACIDAYLLAQKKAKAWDELLAMADRDWPELVPTMNRLLMSQILEK